MASLEQVGELVTTELQERVDRLVSVLKEDTPDFGEVAGLADAIGEVADQTATIYLDLEQTLMRGLHGAQAESNEQPRNQQQGSRREQRQQRTDENGSAVEDVTKEELLEQAREVNVHGRSSMSKLELAEAVEA